MLVCWWEVASDCICITCSLFSLFFLLLDCLYLKISVFLTLILSPILLVRSKQADCRYLDAGQGYPTTKGKKARGGTTAVGIE